MAKSVEDKLTGAKAAYAKAKDGASETSTPEEKKGLRTAHKNLKRAQRKTHLASVKKAKTEDMEKRQLANSGKIKDKSDKKEAAEATKIAALAEEQAKQAAEAKAKEAAAKEAEAKEAEAAKAKESEKVDANEDTVKDTSVPQEVKEAAPKAEVVHSEDETQEIPPEVLESIARGEKG